jgi:Ca2+-binding RTX toxin-like protein
MRFAVIKRVAVVATILGGLTVASVGLVTSSAGAAPPLCNGQPATIVGTDSAETIPGTPGNDVIVALGGNDTVQPSAGDDTICGGGGDDTINGGIGNDTILGEDGNDLLQGGKGDDTLYGGVGDDNVQGEQGADTVNGGDGQDVVTGGIDNDIVNGDAGFDLCDPNNDPVTAGTNVYSGCEAVGLVATSLAVSPAITVIPLSLYTFSARLTTVVGAFPIPFRTVSFSAGSTFLCSAVTNLNGVATCSANLLTSVVTTLLAFGYNGVFAGGPSLLPSSGHGALLAL